MPVHTRGRQQLLSRPADPDPGRVSASPGDQRVPIPREQTPTAFGVVHTTGATASRHKMWIDSWQRFPRANQVVRNLLGPVRERARIMIDADSPAAEHPPLTIAQGEHPRLPYIAADQAPPVDVFRLMYTSGVWPQAVSNSAACTAMALTIVAPTAVDVGPTICGSPVIVTEASPGSP